MMDKFNKSIFFFLLIIHLFISFFYSQVYSQVIYTKNDVDICNSKFKIAIEKNLSLKSINEIVVEIAKTFIGTNYEANTLDKEEFEKLIIHLTGLDCYTFLESSIVFARCIKKGLTDFQDFVKELENIRYRDGKLGDYTSRLHYFSDWIYDMNKRKIGKDITKEIGGKPYKKRINFMSTHIDSYPQLQKNYALVKQIKQIERNISERNYYYIPQDDIEKIESKINDGDIIGITTNIEGLDIAHTGIAIKQKDGRVYLLHAPNVGYKVQVTEKPLADYIKFNKKQTGIMVLRLMEIQ